MLSVVCVSLRMKGDLKMKGKVESRRMIDNKGFSLVELLIAVAIAAIVGGSVFGFMTVGAKTFGQTSTDVHLQNEAQLAFNQIQDLVIDTVVGLDYVYITGDDFGDDSNKVVTDAEIPVGVKGKKLIMYNNYGSGRDIYEIVWKADEQKLYYNEYKVDPSDPDKAVKGVKVVDESLMAEFVTGFAADLSLIETKRVARLEITYEKDGRPYTSSHNITLRNKIVSGNEIPEYVVSTNTIPVVKHIDDATIYAEPGDDFQLNDADFPVMDSEGNILSGTSRFWKLDPSDTNYTNTVALGTEVSLDGRLKVSASQINPISLLVSTGDGTATGTITVQIIRIRRIENIRWQHTGSIGKGEKMNSATPSPEDLIADEEFKLSVDESDITGTNLDKTSYIGNTIENRVVFIKTDGTSLFDIKSQDGLTCSCKMSSSLTNGAGATELEFYKNGEKGKVKSFEIGVAAVAVYSMGGRGYSAPPASDINLNKSTFDYESATADPRNVGASSYKSTNRYMENNVVKPVVNKWTGASYAAESSFNIITENEMSRGQHNVVKFKYGGQEGSMDVLKNMKLEDGSYFEPNDYTVVVDISLTERTYKQGEGGTEYTSTTVYPYSDLNWVGGEGANWGLNCPESFNANSEIEYKVTFYLFKVNMTEEERRDPANKYKLNMEHHQIYVRSWDGNVANSGNTSTGRNSRNESSKGINLSPDDLEKYDLVSNSLPVVFPRLKLTYNHAFAGADPYFAINGDDNQYAIQSTRFYAKPFGKEDLWDKEEKVYFKYTHAKQFKIAHNYLTCNYYKMVDNSWITYDSDGRFYKSGDQGEVKFEKGGSDGEQGGTFMLNTRPSNFTASTPKHLRLVPSYTYEGRNDILFDSAIDVMLWNVEIPSFSYKEWIFTKNTVAEYSYFPVPSDSDFPGKKSRQVWKGAMCKNSNKEAPAIYYSITEVSNGINSETTPTYNMTLEYLVGASRYQTIATYKCNYNSTTGEWEWTKDK